MNLLPWKSMLRRFAHEHGFIDPLALLARMQQFAQPSEVQHPIELLRAGAAMHGRGLLNARIIQHNLDWLWPYWVQRQFDPADPAFVPRAFSLTHINLTHRNWTALGLADLDSFPIVDPAGLVTPLWDGWSIDAWIGDDAGHWLCAARDIGCTEQHIHVDGTLAVETRVAGDGLALSAWVEACIDDSGQPVLDLHYRAHSETPGRFAVSLRPFNPEGVALLHTIAIDDARRGWTIDDTTQMALSVRPEQHLLSRYADGDVFLRLDEASADEHRVHCPAGMASAAALYELAPAEEREIHVTMPFAGPAPRATALPAWPQALAGTCELELPDARYQALFDAARYTLPLLAPRDAYPGPYTYKRFWFRDAAYLVEGLLALGMHERASRALASFPARQKANGYFHSQDGEWDSNGEALWTLARVHAHTARRPDAQTVSMARRGAEWILKRLTPDDGHSPHAGLMPAGFSAEHLGPNDYYYWDDFWSVAGLESAAELLDAAGETRLARRYAQAARALRAVIDRSIAATRARLRRDAIPAAPYRRMDAGAVGNLCAAHPLQLLAPDDPRLTDTVEYLLNHHLVDGGFFQDMIHSGINAYLTLHLAQALLRAGDPRQGELVECVARLASPTGQWPEAIHPRTGGGCMGDGQHGWAASEWVLMLRNWLVREDNARLIVASGLPPRWLHGETTTRARRLRNRHGEISLTIDGDAAGPRVRWDASWHAPPAEVVIDAPGYVPERIESTRGECRLRRVQRA